MRTCRSRLAAAIAAALALGAAAAALPEDARAAAVDRGRRSASAEATSAQRAILPLRVIERAELLRSGAFTLAEFLRRLPGNAFGSPRPHRFAEAQSFAGLSLRGLGSARTLVLVDGRRLPTAAMLGHSQDLNAIPLAAVQRIEVYPPGASARFGSDAMGGAVNIVTRSQFTGVELSAGRGEPEHPGGETEQGSALLGVSGERGSVVAGIAYDNRGIVLRRERDLPASQSMFSNTFWSAAPAPGSAFGFVPAQLVRVPGFGSVVPGGCSGAGFHVEIVNGFPRCLYELVGQAADEVELRTETLFSRARYRIGESWTVRLDGSVARVKSFGRLPPSPSSHRPPSAPDLLLGPFIPVGSPNHPALRFPDGGYEADAPYFVAHRFAAVGDRETSTEGRVHDFALGAEGQVGTFAVKFGLRSVDSKYHEFGRNYIVAPVAQQFVSSGAYDIYDPFSTPRAVLDAMSATINRDAVTRLEEAYATAATPLWDMPGGMSRLTFGIEVRDEEYADTYDTLQTSGQIVGLDPPHSAQASRNLAAVSMEWHMPLASRLDARLMARRDDYNAIGAFTSSLLAAAWRPWDALTVRASAGRSFRAPTLDVVGAAPTPGQVGYYDPAFGCAGPGPFCHGAIPHATVPNPHLSFEHVRHWSVGLDWQPRSWFGISADYHDVRIENRITQLSHRLLVDCLLGTVECPAGVSPLPFDAQLPDPSLGLGVARHPLNNQIVFVQSGFGNLGSLSTESLDLHLRSSMDLAQWGMLQADLFATRTWEFRIDEGPDLIGDPGMPRLRASLQVQWSLGDYEFAWGMHHIAGTRSSAGVWAQQRGFDYGYPHTLPSWTTHELQAAWQAPWNGRLIVGIRNAGDRHPTPDWLQQDGIPLQPALYDDYGRTPYIRYTHRF